MVISARGVTWDGHAGAGQRFWLLFGNRSAKYRDDLLHAPAGGINHNMVPFHGR
jgi:hypothetical protein